MDRFKEGQKVIHRRLRYMLIRVGTSSYSLRLSKPGRQEFQLVSGIGECFKYIYKVLSNYVTPSLNIAACAHPPPLSPSYLVMYKVISRAGRRNIPQPSCRTGAYSSTCEMGSECPPLRYHNNTPSTSTRPNILPFFVNVILFG